MEKIGLLLTGGGARVAYQAGVLRAIAEVCEFKKNPFNVVSGVSGGAINGAWISSQNSDFVESTQLLWDGWARITHDQIYNTDLSSFLKIGIHWLRDLSLKGEHEHSHFRSLLDSAPLKQFIETKLNFGNLKKKISAGHLHGIAVTTTNYNTGASVVFYDGDPAIAPWDKEWRQTRRVHLTAGHILASTAIPIFFPPVELDDGFHGDGGLKMSSPLSPLIHMGAEKILAIGIHHKEAADSTKNIAIKKITMGDVAGTMLNTLFFHPIEMDVERFNRINRTISLLTKEQLERGPDKLRHIPLLTIQPSVDLGSLGIEFFNRFPPSLRFFLRGIGASEIRSRDMMSYLAFEECYVRALLELGYKDGLTRETEIRNFFE